MYKRFLRFFSLTLVLDILDEGRERISPVQAEPNAKATTVGRAQTAASHLTAHRQVLTYLSN